MSVVIATRDRPELLRRVTGQIVAQMQAGDELIVVDDTSGRPAAYEALGPQGRVIHSHGRGPAIARNLGWRAAAGDLIAFTDDDVSLGAGWLDAIRAEFAGDSALVAAEGRTVSREYDLLFEYSVSSEAARNGLTCNVGYRRSALEQLGGFDEAFPFAHCEDLDLFTRAARLGPVKFSEAMLVDHEPRALVPATFARRGAWLASERRLYTKHAELRPYPLSPLACALLSYFRWPVSALFDARARRSPARLRRAVVLTVLWWWHAAKATADLAFSRPPIGAAE